MAALNLKGITKIYPTAPTRRKPGRRALLKRKQPPGHRGRVIAVQEI